MALIGWSLLTDDVKELISVNTPEQLSATNLNVERIGEIIKFDRSYCYEAINSIRRGDLLSAAKLFEREADIYRFRGVSLLEDHARRDMRFFGSLADRSGNSNIIS
jgi:hypothetical protein